VRQLGDRSSTNPCKSAVCVLETATCPKRRALGAERRRRCQRRL
jgi:hypothetical protein